MNNANLKGFSQNANFLYDVSFQFLQIKNEKNETKNNYTNDC